MNHERTKHREDSSLADPVIVGPYEIEALRGVAAVLRRLPPAARTVLAEHIDALATQPRPAGYEAFLANFCSISIGTYRIAYEVDDEARLITITHIGQRRTSHRPG